MMLPNACQIFISSSQKMYLLEKPPHSTDRKNLKGLGSGQLRSSSRLIICTIDIADHGSAHSHEWLDTSNWGECSVKHFCRVFSETVKHVCLLNVGITLTKDSLGKGDTWFWILIVPERHTNIPVQL